MSDRYITFLRQGFTSMWINWAISFGSMILVTVISPFVNKVWLPLLVLFIVLCLMSYLRYENADGRFECKRMIYVAINTLSWTAGIMVFINIIHADWFPWDLYSLKDHSAPHIVYVTSLILFPVLAIGTAVGMKRDQESAFCLECRAAHGYDPDSGALSPLYSRDTRYQMRLICRIASFISIVVWGYYAFYYVNTNLNGADIYFYDLFPAGLYLLSLFFMASRYSGMFAQYRERYGSNRKHRVTLRFLILHDDYIFLTSQKQMLLTHQLIDTPATIFLDTANQISDTKAAKYFDELAGVEPEKIKYLYRNNDVIPDCAQKHFAVFLDDKAQLPNDRIEGQWYSQNELNQLLHKRLIAPSLAAEIKRIYTMTMAWKTYDREGRRLYPIKHYRPTFRLLDFKDWDIDYNDLQWLSVANNNQDRPLWRLRQLWRRTIRIAK